MALNWALGILGLIAPTSRVILSLKMLLASYTKQLFPPLWPPQRTCNRFASKLNFAPLRTTVYPPRRLGSSPTTQSICHLFPECPHPALHLKCPSLSLCWIPPPLGLFYTRTLPSFPVFRQNPAHFPKLHTRRARALVKFSLHLTHSPPGTPKIWAEIPKHKKLRHSVQCQE